MSADDRSDRPLALRVIVGLLRLIWTLVVICVPLAGVWIASSLAALSNYPLWIVGLAGALAFPLVPLLWEGLSELLRRRIKARGPKRLSDLRSRGEGFMSGDDRALTLWDRLVLRTLIVNLVFVGGLVWARPATIYAALSARGDWMLDEVDAPWAEDAREVLHAIAERFEWLHERTHDNKYEELVDEDFKAAPPPPSELPPSADEPAKPSPDPSEPDPSEPEAETDDDPGEAELEPAPSHARWPLPPEVHPLIVSMPEQAEASIDAVVEYVVEGEDDEFLRVKALHDWVATRVRYDTQAADVGPIPPQDAQTTFERRLSVCAGYANLLAEMITRAGGKAVVISGHSRGMSGEISGEGHAWNAVEIEGLWYLVDATWDAGASTDGKWGFGYKADYLFTPPAIFGLTHFPEDPGWQLLDPPLSRGEFLRQPVLRPRFFAEGFELIAPQRSQVSVEDRVEVRVANHQGRYLLATTVAEDGAKTQCEVERREGDGDLLALCLFPEAGKYELRLFSNVEQYGDFDYIGSLSVNAGG